MTRLVTGSGLRSECGSCVGRRGGELAERLKIFGQVLPLIFLEHKFAGVGVVEVVLDVGADGGVDRLESWLWCRLPGSVCRCRSGFRLLRRSGCRFDCLEG
jgi:hypothetical protein